MRAIFPKRHLLSSPAACMSGAPGPKFIKSRVKSPTVFEVPQKQKNKMGEQTGEVIASGT